MLKPWEKDTSDNQLYSQGSNENSPSSDISKYRAQTCCFFFKVKYTEAKWDLRGKQSVVLTVRKNDTKYWQKFIIFKRRITVSVNCLLNILFPSWQRFQICLGACTFLMWLGENDSTSRPTGKHWFSYDNFRHLHSVLPVFFPQNLNEMKEKFFKVAI